MRNPLSTLKVIGLLLLVVALSACGLVDLFNGTDDDNALQIEAQVRATLTAVASGKDVSETPSVPTETPPQPTVTATEMAWGTLKGRLSYPSEFLPPQRVVAFDLMDQETYYVTEVPDDGSYTLDVPPGTYLVVAYLMDPYEAGAPPNSAAGYSQAVLCGLTVDCTDHSLVSVQVSAGETVSKVDPGDWYLPPEEKYFWPSDPTLPETGVIKGNLGYPSEFIPPLRVVAFDVNSNAYVYVDTQRNQTTYQINDLAQGSYHVVAYVRDEEPDWPAGYSYFVVCGMAVHCDNHSLVDVHVYAGRVTEDVDPIDFYAQPDEIDWPENPTR